MNEKISQGKNYEGLKAIECYMKKKKNKNFNDLVEKTSYKYFMIDLELRKFFVKINKESKIFSKEFDIDSLTCFSSKLDKEDLGLCDFKFGFQFLINSKKYVLFQKEEKDYFNWIRLLEFHFNKKDIGSFANYISNNQNKNFSNIQKKKNIEKSKSVIADLSKIDDNFKFNNISEDKYDNKSLIETNMNKIDTSENKAKNRETMITENIIEDKKSIKPNKDLLTKSIIKQFGLSNFKIERSNYNNKFENVSPDSKKIVLKLFNNDKNKDTIQSKNNFNYIRTNPEKNINFSNNNQNINEFNFNESPIPFAALKFTNVQADSQHIFEVKSNKFQSNFEIDQQLQKNDFPSINKSKNSLDDSLESQILINNKINGNYICDDDFLDFPTIEKSKNKKYNVNDCNINKYLTRDSLLKEINCQNERRQVNIMNQKEILTHKKIISKSPILERNEKKNSVFYELDKSYFKETPIKKDIVRDKIILENLHYGIDHSNLNKFDNDLKVTIAGVPMTMINKVNFNENATKPDSKKTFKKRANFQEENTFDSKQVITKSGNVINVKKTIVPGDNQNSWTLNLSVFQEKRKNKY